MEMSNKEKQLASLAAALRAEKSKFNHHLLQYYDIVEYTDSIGLWDKRTGGQVKIYY